MTTLVVVLRQMLPGVAYEKWLTMYWSTWTRLVHDTMYPSLGPLDGGKDLLMFGYIDVYVFTVLLLA
jgi:hypothetical protein